MSASKGPRKNNYPFSHPIFGAPSARPQSRNPRRSARYACGFAQSAEPNLTQIWARKLGTYSCADPNLYPETRQKLVEWRSDPDVLMVVAEAEISSPASFMKTVS